MFKLDDIISKEDQFHTQVARAEINVYRRILVARLSNILAGITLIGRK